MEMGGWEKKRERERPVATPILGGHRNGAG